MKHLFTLQEGVSETQYDKMKTRGVRLVVPRRCIPTILCLSVRN